ncbi:MAG TPA: hypothetical protein PK364_00595 [Synergistaceae bacterium]|nr:hypothetical protein [Synergistaceae bacterium]
MKAAVLVHSVSGNTFLPESPTYFGNMSGEMKSFLDNTGLY